MESAEAALAMMGVLRRVKEAWKAGRPIVPIVGAGFSANSGYPILSSICRYLARFLYALDNNLLVPELPDTEPLAKELKELMRKARVEPIHFIENFGWPDRFELTERVARHVLPPERSEQVLLRERSESVNWENHELLEEVITSQFSRLAKESCSRRAASSWQRLHQPDDKHDTGKRTAASLAWDRWTIQGDWRRLIQFFVGYRADYADALFARFGFLRSPGQGHRYMSLLVRLLSIRLIFTFNFDDLIEKSLTDEAISHRIFGMEHGRTLPSPGVLDEELSVIKMHGSHHSILIDERLDRPLDAAYVDRFYDLAGRDALLLVVGCSGDDRRLEDLLVRRIDANKNRRADVCWLYFEREIPLSLRTLGDPVELTERQHKDMKETIHLCPVNSPAAVIRHLLFDISGRFPTSSQFYASQPTAPLMFGKPKNDAINPLRATSWPHSYKSILDVESSERLLELATVCTNETFLVIWIDMEAIHTLAGFVGAIIDACRRVDAELPPAVMPLPDAGPDSQEIALDRLEHALRRQRYAVIIDAMGNYGSSPLMHHSSGLETPQERESGSAEIQLRELLPKLSQKQIGQSILVACKESRKGRRKSTDNDLIRDKDPLLEEAPPGAGGSALWWTCLATFRRTRALPAIRRVLGPLVDENTSKTSLDESMVDEFLQRESQRGQTPIRFLEGADLWFVRDQRDKIYGQATRFASSAAFRLLYEKDKWGIGNKALFQSLLMAFLHRKIGSTYFSFEFMESKDAAGFLEYTYHRLSSIRYFSRAIYLLKNRKADLAVAKHAIKAYLPKWSPMQAIGYFGSFWGELLGTNPLPQKPVLLLRNRRAREIEAFLASWREFEQILRAQISAEQLLHWVRVILEADEGLQWMAGVFIANVDPKNKGDYIPDEDKRCETLRDEMRQYFSRLRLQVNLERGDFEAAKTQADKVIAELDNSKNETNKARIDAKLDRIEVLARTDLEQATDEAKKELRSIDTTQLRKEQHHRYHHMEALVAVSSVSRMFRNGQMELPATSQRDLDNARNHAEKGLEQVRGAGALLASPLEGMIVAAGSSGGAYLPYRSVFRTLKGRILMSQLLAKPTNVDQTMDHDLVTFRRAMRQFDQAKAGIGSQYALLLGWAELHAAESSLFLVRRTFERDDDDVVKKLGFIRTKVLSCRSHLNSAIKALRAGRRNALWWRQCYQLVGQYHVERLFWGLCKLGFITDMQKTSDNNVELGKQYNKERIDVGLDLLKRHSRGLEALAGYKDYSLQSAAAVGHSWFRRTYAEIQLGSSAAIAFSQIRNLDEVNAPTLVRFVPAIVKFPDELRSRDFRKWKTLNDYLTGITEQLGKVPTVPGDTLADKCYQWQRLILHEIKRDT
jgi:hypothetical protein